MITCKNCASEFEGKYCSHCGQKASTKRFSTKILFSQFMDKFLPLDRGVFFTGKTLMTQPGVMLRGYLDGKRVGYTKPLQFLLIVAAISLIFFSMDDFQKGMEAGMKNDNPQDAKYAEIAAFQQKVVGFIQSHLTLLMLGMLPFLALIGRWFYRKHDVNLAEHFVLNCYLMAGCSIISFPILATLHFMGKSVMAPFFIVGLLVVNVGYYTWCHISFFRESNRLWNGIKAALVYLIAYILYIITVGLFSVIATIVYFTVFKKM